MSIQEKLDMQHRAFSTRYSGLKSCWKCCLEKAQSICNALERSGIGASSVSCKGLHTVSRDLTILSLMRLWPSRCHGIFCGH